MTYPPCPPPPYQHLLSPSLSHSLTHTPSLLYKCLSIPSLPHLIPVSLLPLTPCRQSPTSSQWRRIHGRISSSSSKEPALWQWMYWTRCWPWIPTRESQLTRLSLILTSPPMPTQMMRWVWLRHKHDCINYYTCSLSRSLTTMLLRTWI